jgi:hypothetical protein
MWPCRQTVYSLLLFIICILHVRSNDLVTKFDIVLKTPDNTTLPTELPHVGIFNYHGNRYLFSFLNRNL